jgi:anti-anti-sigma regulatory factor
MLRITIHETDDAMAIDLEGRIAGPWVAELGAAWAEAAPRLSSRKLVLNLLNVTYVDKRGAQALRNIYAQTRAKLIAATPSVLYLAGEITGDDRNGIEAGHASAS